MSPVIEFSFDTSNSIHEFPLIKVGIFTSFYMFIHRYNKCMLYFCIFCGDPKSAKAAFRAVTFVKPDRVPPA